MRAPLVYSLLFTLGSVSADVVNFKATFGSTPSPFRIDVDAAFIAETKLKASLARYALEIDVPAWSDGPPTHNVSTVRDYWANQYDWFSVQDELNKKYVIVALKRNIS